MKRTAIATAALAAVLTACTPFQGEPEQVFLPYCRDVWAPSLKLPADYIGCHQMNETGDDAPYAFQTPCRSGTTLYYFDRRFWGLPAHRVHMVAGDAADDPRYQRVWRSCRGY